MRIKAFYLYLAIIIWAILLGILLKFAHLNVTGLGITLAFLSLIFIPGFFLWRLLGLRNDLPVKVLYLIALGFIWLFFPALLGLVFNLTLGQVLWLSSILSGLLFILAAVKDRKIVFEVDFSCLQRQSAGDWLIISFIIISSILAFLVIDAQSDKLIGDGWFYLAILQKIVSGEGLGPLNLSAVKMTTLSLVYSFPIWHILVGEFAQILDITIFTALKQVLLPLTIITLLTWYCLLGVIFKNRYFVAVGYLALLLIFLRDNSFYYLVAIPSPDSLNRLLILPVLLGLTVDYIFEEKIKRWTVIFIILLALFLGLIHFIQLIYWLIIILTLALLIIIFKVNNQSWRRLGYLLVGFLILIFPYFVVQYQNLWSFLKNNAAAFTNDNPAFKTFLGANVIYRYALLSVPILCLFIKKQKHLIILLAIVLTALLIYWPFFGLRLVFLKYLGPIFVDRSLANIPHFIFFGLLLFLIIIGCNYLLVRVFRKLILVVDAILILIILSLPLMKNWLIAIVDGYLLNETKIFYGYSFWLCLAVLVVASIILYGKFRSKITLPWPKDILNFSILTILVILILAWPYLGKAEKVISADSRGSFMTNRQSLSASDIDFLGGQKTLDFFRNHSREVFLTDNVTLSQLILLYSPNYAAEYPYGIKKFSVSPYFYDPSLGSRGRLNILDSLQVNFVVLRHSEEAAFLEQNPDYFRKVFENNFVYKNKAKDIIVYEYLK